MENYTAPVNPGAPSPATGGDNVVAEQKGNSSTSEDDRQLREVDEYSGDATSPPQRGSSPVSGLGKGPGVSESIYRNDPGEEIPPPGSGDTATLGTWPVAGAALDPTLSKSLG